MVLTAFLSLLVFGSALLLGASFERSIPVGCVVFLIFSLNLARAEIEELKLILDKAQPDWCEQNAGWTSTWDWNRSLKRRLRKQRRSNRPPES